MTPVGAVITAVALVGATAGGVLFYRLSRKRREGRPGAGLRVLAIVLLGLLLGAAIGIARAIGG